MSDYPSAVEVRVPAKVNLRLDVGPARPDGFHELRTAFHAVDLYDTVRVCPAASPSVTVTGPEGVGLVADRTNLGWRAAARLADWAGIEPAVAVHIDKAIPVAAGLAGGSADAAGALVACARLWNLTVSIEQLTLLAADLGSDVGFGLHGGTAWGTGRGEVLTPVTGAGRFHWVLAAADGALSTPAVYAELDRLRSLHSAARVPALGPDSRAFGPHNAVEEFEAALVGGDAATLAPLLSNDLQAPALSLAPYLADTLAAGERLGALAGMVSGSGPTVVFLAADADAARQLAAGLTTSGSCRFARAVVGGVPGAHLVTTPSDSEAN